ncbi:uncharacterized protein LOC101783449 [Setaria italica]|uniref:uncharacterized protein LOC101783449 n=1 Tax=Setaria italica TaxID=4555 RepID=UPI000648154F|nr:uncharacterized protein LOC101783449 [Setaria italica]
MISVDMCVFLFQNRASGGNSVGGDGEEEAGEGGAFELPCLGNATTVSLDLGFLGLAVPPAGVFAQLTELSLNRVRFHGPLELGDAVSSLRCPCLQKLSVGEARGLANLPIHSEPLLQLSLLALVGLQQLTLVAKALKKLAWGSSITRGRPVVNISTTQLVSLVWFDSYDPTSIQPCGLAQLKKLSCAFCVYDSHDSWRIRGFQQLLKGFQEPCVCPSDCVCDHSTDWKTMELTLGCLQEVAIDMEGTDHQVAFVKRLFTWAVVLKRLDITFNPSISECKVRELHQTLSSFSGPETRVEFYMYESSDSMKFYRKRYWLAP